MRSAPLWGVAEGRAYAFFAKSDYFVPGYGGTLNLASIFENHSQIKYSKECNKRNRKKRCTERVSFGSVFGCYTCPVACKSAGVTRLQDHVRHWCYTCVGPCKGVLYCIRFCSRLVASTTLVLDSVLVWVRAENLRISRNVPWICVGRSGCCLHVLGSR